MENNSFDQTLTKDLASYESLNSEILQKESELESIKKKRDDVKSSISGSLKVVQRKTYKFKGYTLGRRKLLKWEINNPTLFMKWASANLNKKDFFELFEPKIKSLNSILNKRLEQAESGETNEATENLFVAGTVIKSTYHSLTIKSGGE